MKKVIFIFVFAAVAMLAFASSAYAQEPSIISVNGEGSVTVVPDVAYIFLGVETQEESAHAAQLINSARMTEVIAAIIALGVNERDIQTMHFSIHPVHVWHTEHPEIIGYRVSNGIQITLRNTDMVGEVIAAASAAGSNMASNVSFGLIDSTATYNEALALAVADAMEKAEIIARALNRNLGDVASVSEFGHMGIMPRAMTSGGMMFDAMSFGGVPAHGGELAIVARIQVTFFLD